MTINRRNQLRIMKNEDLINNSTCLFSTPAEGTILTKQADKIISSEFGSGITMKIGQE